MEIVRRFVNREELIDLCFDEDYFGRIGQWPILAKTICANCETEYRSEQCPNCGDPKTLGWPLAGFLTHDYHKNGRVVEVYLKDDE